MSKMLPGERLLWEGRPVWRAVARDVMHVGWIALYFALTLIWNAASDRLNGLGPAQTLLRAVPLFLAGLAVVGACSALAWAMARTTRYTITTDRCILHYGVALTGTLSIPHRRVARVSVAAREGGAGDIRLTLKPGPGVRYLKLWPHVRPWRFSKPEPMLRGVPDAAGVAALLSHAVAQVTPGVLHATATTSRSTAVPDAILSPAGD